MKTFNQLETFALLLYCGVRWYLTLVVFNTRARYRSIVNTYRKSNCSDVNEWNLTSSCNDFSFERERSCCRGRCWRSAETGAIWKEEGQEIAECKFHDIYMNDRGLGHSNSEWPLTWEVVSWGQCWAVWTSGLQEAVVDFGAMLLLLSLMGRRCHSLYNKQEQDV